MNFLMHLYLSDGSDEGLLGNLMGDFVKGAIEESCSPLLRQGIEEHRRIDAFAQGNPFFQKSRQRLDPKFGHCRGIMVDIFYDHILAREWHRHHPQPLEDFAAHVYRLLQYNFDQLPPDLQRIAPRMIEHDWLAGYRNPQVIGRVLQNLSRRLSRPTPLAQGLPQLKIHYPQLLEDCRQFIHAARHHLGHPPPTG
ncbi:ACP phosphodiesterase [Geoalkalibacter subterraneus]|jgi:acyl carrier protein phosphodiesterase|uniref:ACP phosphodiesterase n=1 Tax=Geoalkalibacter subterraneus TaxID=483547 RepID=A0A0B5FCK9_9BACT|nr:ACP phosphodiesterase [Geoalkalibacter subterraneus]AJF05917.1 hypothetical protein GSUB_04150 [Geoalkalibacter subterraneus]